MQHCRLFRCSSSQFRINLPNSLTALGRLAKVDAYFLEVSWYCLPPCGHVDSYIRAPLLYAAIARALCWVSVPPYRTVWPRPICDRQSHITPTCTTTPSAVAVFYAYSLLNKAWRCPTVTQKRATSNSKRMRRRSYRRKSWTPANMGRNVGGSNK